jgi:hypothetical protein
MSDLRGLTKHAAMSEMQTSKSLRRPTESIRNQGMKEARKNHYERNRRQTNPNRLRSLLLTVKRIPETRLAP